jgi:hypothetical protein
LLSNVTAPTWVSALPVIVAPVAIVIDWETSRLPIKTEPVPKVAELPTCQKTLAAFAPLVRITMRPVVVVSVDAIWKTNTAFESPRASSVRSPDDMASEEVDL